jgi:UDP-N-acetyl-alpha-D-muramoyl-L-alanyl-L-glutamate epimerase
MRMSDFRYDSFDHTQDGTSLKLTFHFSSGEHAFTPNITISDVTQEMVEKMGKDRLDAWVFQIGMTEVASYWKAFLSPTVEIKCGYLSADQIKFWQKLLYKGLGEFFFQNKIQPFEPEIKEKGKREKAKGEIEKNSLPFTLHLSPSVLVPVGGGKDSIVTLELLAKAGYQISTVSGLVGASQDVIRLFGKQKQNIIFERDIDPHLLELNSQGHPNGHTPFSSVLAFLSTFTAELFGIPYVTLSNEGSADEPTAIWNGIDVNHQYSKSFEFEQDFRAYIASALPGAPQYFSFLRPLAEIQIVKLFTQYSAYFDTFRSCNVGQKTNSWCGKCPKCTFVALMLSAFEDDETITKIFGYPILENETLSTIVDELIGISEFKPFECVGTREESQVALYLALKKRASAPALLEHYRSYVQEVEATLEEKATALLMSFRTEHALPKAFENVLYEQK